MLYVFEFWWLDNTLRASTLVWRSLLVAAAVGAALGWWLGRRLDDAFDRFRAVVIVAFLAGLFGPLLGSLSNRLLSAPPRQEAVQVVRVEAFAQSRLGFMKGEKVKPEGYYLFVLWGDELERLRFRVLPDPPPARGDTLHLEVLPGLWGFAVALPPDDHTNRIAE